MRWLRSLSVDRMLVANDRPWKACACRPDASKLPVNSRASLGDRRRLSGRASGQQRRPMSRGGLEWRRARVLSVDAPPSRPCGCRGAGPDEAELLLLSTRRAGHKEKRSASSQSCSAWAPKQRKEKKERKWNPRASCRGSASGFSLASGCFRRCCTGLPHPDRPYKRISQSGKAADRFSHSSGCVRSAVKAYA